MVTITPGNWFEPYASFGAEEIRWNLLIAGTFGEVGMKTLDEAYRVPAAEKLLLAGTYPKDILLPSGAELTVDIDACVLSDDSIHRDINGKAVVYPFGTEGIDFDPKSKDGRRVKGFGNLSVTIDVTNENELKLKDKKNGKVYPWRLLVQMPSVIYYSLPWLYAYETSAWASYDLWRPESTQEQPGKLCIPAELPKLKTIRMRLDRIEDSKILEDRLLFDDSILNDINYRT